MGCCVSVRLLFFLSKDANFCLQPIERNNVNYCIFLMEERLHEVLLVKGWSTWIILIFRVHLIQILEMHFSV